MVILVEGKIKVDNFKIMCYIFIRIKAQCLCLRERTM